MARLLIILLFCFYVIYFQDLMMEFVSFNCDCSYRYLSLNYFLLDSFLKGYYLRRYSPFLWAGSLINLDCFNIRRKLLFLCLGFVLEVYSVFKDLFHFFKGSFYKKRLDLLKISLKLILRRIKYPFFFLETICFTLNCQI